MIKLNTKKAKISFAFTVALIIISIVFFLLRGPYLSNSIKRMIIPVLENVTRERIIIDKAVINLFPFYVQAKGFKLFDKDGNRLLWITKTRAYIDLLGLLSKEVRIRRLTMKEPDLTAGEDDLQRLLDNISQSSVGEAGEYQVSLKNVKMTEGNLKYESNDGSLGVSGTGLFLNMMTGRSGSVVDVVMKEGSIKFGDNAGLDGGFEGRFKLQDRKITVLAMDVHSLKSGIEAKGELNLSAGGTIEDGNFTVKAKISVETINSIFALNRDRDGMLTINGSVRLKHKEGSDWPGVSLDLKTKSDFYLETLMEIVEVQDNISGKLSLEGEITGTFPDLRGRGSVKLADAVFDTLPVDDVIGEIIFKDRKFTLTKFTAHTYDGELKGEAYLTLPYGDYTVTADISGINSDKLLEFIKWEAPFQTGRINGNFQLSHENDNDIVVLADLTYKNKTKKGHDLMSRLDTIFISLEMKENILKLKDSILSSSDSALLLDGNIDFNKETLEFDMLLESKNAYDLTVPEYKGFIAPVTFAGTASGPLNDPVIAGRLEADSGSIHNIQFKNAFADVTYRISSLTVKKLKIEQENSTYDISGSIDFRKSTDLFNFKDPYYTATASIENINITPFITSAYEELPITGYANGTLLFKGDSNAYSASGELEIYNGDIYGQPFDRINVRSSLHSDNIEFESIEAFRGESSLNAEGVLFFNGKYELNVSSDRIRLADFPIYDERYFDAGFGMNVKGAGTVDRPNLDFSLEITESRFQKIDIGTGTISGSLKDNDVVVKGSFVDGIVNADAKISLDDSGPWSLDIKFKKGNYDFLISGLFSEPPRDLSASMEGEVSLVGLGSKLSMQSKIDSLNLSLYGYSFRNKETIELELKDNKYTVKSFLLIGDNADLSVSGSMNISKDYNLALEGNMDISPLRSLSDNLESLRGQGVFKVGITGPWNNPELEGEIKLDGAAASVSGSPYRIGPLYGTLYLKKDRITFDSLSTDFAGGNILLSGAGYFENLTLHKLFISSEIADIRIRPVEGISVELDGKLFYERSLKGSSLSGDINIEKAKYEKRIEWKSWLLGFKEMKEDTVKYPEFLSETALNVRIVSDNITIDNNIARTAVKMSINVTGTVGEFGLIGRMEANEGSVFFRSNEFNILEGSSVDFIKPNGIEPMFHIIADTYASDYYIRLSMDGTIDKFTLTLYSDPPLTESEILSLLTFGQIDKEARGIESGIAAGEATALLTGTLQDKVEEEFKYLTGFERFDIEPHTTTQGAFSPKVTVGKRLLEDRIFVTYSSTVGAVEEQIIEVEYKLNENLTLIGSRNEIGSAGVDFKYRIEFK